MGTVPKATDQGSVELSYLEFLEDLVSCADIVSTELEIMVSFLKDKTRQVLATPLLKSVKKTQFEIIAQCGLGFIKLIKQVISPLTLLRATPSFPISCISINLAVYQ